MCEKTQESNVNKTRLQQTMTSTAHQGKHSSEAQPKVPAVFPILTENRLDIIGLQLALKTGLSTQASKLKRFAFLKNTIRKL